MALCLVAACGEDLRPGFCDTDRDCKESNQRCDLGPGANFHKCVPGVNVEPPRDAGRADRPDIDNPGGTRDAGGDAPIETGPIPCTGPAECSDPRRPFCQAGMCTGCATPDAGTCPAARPICDPATGGCVECTGNAQCTKPEAPLCMNQTCSPCAGNDAACKARDATRPVCAPSGRCAECTGNAQCTAAPGKAFCVNEACVGCQQAGATACAGATPVCNATSGACVECQGDIDCKTPAAPFCLANKCVPCSMVPATRCAMLNPMLPACGPSGTCVGCNTSADCTFDPARPVCNTTTFMCRACTADSECVAKGGAAADPGVCLGAGRCATAAETIYVSNGGACGTSGGSKAMPLCSPQDAVKLLSPTRALVLITGAVAGLSWPLAGTPPVTVVGQQQAVINGGVLSSIKLDGAGEVLFRDLTVRGSEAWSIAASGGAFLQLRNVVVQNNNGGGVLIDGARFDIRNTLIANNGPGQAGIAGGMSVAAVSGTPAKLENVSIKMNNAVGLTCGAGVTVMATGLFAKDNMVRDVALSCMGVATCGAEGAGCGAGF